jgi:hypothetical protein
MELADLNRPAKIAMIAMTTSSSIKVKAALRIEIGHRGLRMARNYARLTDLSSAKSSTIFQGRPCSPVNARP